MQCMYTSWRLSSGVIFIDQVLTMLLGGPTLFHSASENGCGGEGR